MDKVKNMGPTSRTCAQTCVVTLCFTERVLSSCTAAVKQVGGRVGAGSSSVSWSEESLDSTFGCRRSLKPLESVPPFLWNKHLGQLTS